MSETSAVGFSLSATINDKRNLVMQTHIAADASREEMYTLIEKLCSIADVLDTRYRLHDMKLILEKAREELPVHERKLQEYEEKTVREYRASGKRSDFEWKGQAHANRDNMLTTVAGARQNIIRFEKAIAEAEAELGAMNGASSTANRFSGAANS